MSYTNISALIDANPLTLNISGLNSTTGALNVVRETTANTIGDVWFLVAIVILFCFFIWVFMGRDKNFFMDFSRSIVKSSGWCFFLSTAFLLSGLISTLIPLFWFSSTLLIGVGAVHKLKTKGL